jgi:nitrogen fixation/metabolism regulation signal transduction histidine kinase
VPARFQSGEVARQIADCQLAKFNYRDTEWHAAATTIEHRQGVVAADVTARSQLWRQELRQSLFIFVPLALFLTAVGSWLLATLTMRPVNRLREAMRGMTGSSLDQRLPKQHEDREFQDLIDAYNSMLARLEKSFHQA